MHSSTLKRRSPLAFGTFLLLGLVCICVLRFCPSLHAYADSSGSTSVSVTVYTEQGTMADGNQAHDGACAALVTQFPFGTQIQLFSPDDLNNPVFSCTIEDTGTNVCENDIDVARPGELDFALNFGRQDMQLQVVGFDQDIADQAAANHPSSSGCGS